MQMLDSWVSFFFFFLLQYCNITYFIKLKLMEFCCGREVFWWQGWKLHTWMWMSLSSHSFWRLCFTFWYLSIMNYFKMFPSKSWFMDSVQKWGLHFRINVCFLEIKPSSRTSNLVTLQKLLSAQDLLALFSLCSWLFPCFYCTLSLCWESSLSLKLVFIVCLYYFPAVEWEIRRRFGTCWERRDQRAVAEEGNSLCVQPQWRRAKFESGQPTCRAQGDGRGREGLGPSAFAPATHWHSDSEKGEPIGDSVGPQVVTTLQDSAVPPPGTPGGI